MQAYYEIETELSTNHEIHLSLPSNIPAGKIKIAIIYSLEKPEKPQRKMASFLSSLPDQVEGGVSREFIQMHIQEERDNPVSPPNTMNSLLDFIGAGKNYARFESSEAMNRYLAEQRETWEIK